MMTIVVFFVAHWYLSVFAQSFFLHRYMAHRMFRLSDFWARFFYIFTFFAQGSSYLHPKSYAQLHLEHHKHSDTKDDPHSPHLFKDVVRMMWHTRQIYLEFRDGTRQSSSSYINQLVTIPLIDRLGSSYFVSFLFCVFYTLIYVLFAPNPWWYLLLPIHFLMGPIHGAFVNWCGHKYGYRNFELEDCSRNTFLWDLFFVGEAFQNNHHRYPNRINFAVKWYELDLAYPAIWVLSKIGIIQAQKTG